jgi:hypothetical protein
MKTSNQGLGLRCTNPKEETINAKKQGNMTPLKLNISQ